MKFNFIKSLHATGGQLNWDRLTMSQKNALMKIYINNGITDINSIKEHYNSFADGGGINNPLIPLKKKTVLKGTATNNIESAAATAGLYNVDTFNDVEYIPNYDLNEVEISAPRNTDYPDDDYHKAHAVEAAGFSDKVSQRYDYQGLYPLMMNIASVPLGIEGLVQFPEMINGVRGLAKNLYGRARASRPKLNNRQYDYNFGEFDESFNSKIKDPLIKNKQEFDFRPLKSTSYSYKDLDILAEKAGGTFRSLYKDLKNNVSDLSPYFGEDIYNFRNIDELRETIMRELPSGINLNDPASIKSFSNEFIKKHVPKALSQQDVLNQWWLLPKANEVVPNSNVQNILTNDVLERALLDPNRMSVPEANESFSGFVNDDLLKTPMRKLNNQEYNKLVDIPAGYGSNASAGMSYGDRISFKGNPSDETMAHELRHILEDEFPLTPNESSILNNAYGETVALGDIGPTASYDITQEFSTMNLDARNAILSTPEHHTLSITEQNKLLDNISNSELVKKVMYSDGYWHKYLKKLGVTDENFTKIDFTSKEWQSRIQGWKDAMKYVGVAIPSVGATSTLYNFNNNYNAPF